MGASEAVDKIIAEVIRPALIRVFQMGEEGARGRLISLLQEEGALTVQTVVRPAKARTPVPGYGALTRRIRDALAQASSDMPDGVNAEAVHAICSDLSIMQVRSALKTLAKAGDAVRVDRGSYLPARSFAQAKTGGVAPPASFNQISQSEEAVASGPKGNGTPMI